MPVNDIKIVILGQDPYPNPKHANGLAFATKQVDFNKRPYSLKIIVDDLYWIDQNVLIDKEFDQSLLNWEKQGIFLINTSLTVMQGKPGSHSKYWDWFTTEVIRYLSQRRDNIIWFAWGKHAQSKTDILVNNDTHIVFKSTHPAAARYGHEFNFTNKFIQANEYLKEWGKDPIQWV